MEQNQSVRTRRVGTVTFGCILILFGILFMIHIFVPALKYEIIFRLWPCIFIFLGAEVLIGNYQADKTAKEGGRVNFIYDKAAILLIICLTFFAMLMAAMDFAMQCERGFIQF